MQDGEVVPVGSSRPVRVEMRVVAASQSSIADLVQSGTFRPDLHARLNGFLLRLPTLAERRVDIGLIIRSILTRLGGSPLRISREAGQALCLHGWRQNIRELEQVLRHAIVLCRGSLVTLRDLPEAFSESTVMASARAGARHNALPSPEVVQRCLDEHGGVIEAARRALGLKNRFVLLRLIKKHGLVLRH
jgi:two-component system NtrC family response regulator